MCFRESRLQLLTQISKEPCPFSRLSFVAIEVIFINANQG